MFDVAGGVRCREDVAQRRGYSDRSNAAHSTSLPPRPASRASSLAASGLALTPRPAFIDFGAAGTACRLRSVQAHW